MVLTDYNTYLMSNKEKTKYILLGCLALSSLAFIFFNNLYLAGMLGLGGFLYPRYKAVELAKRRKAELTLQFKEALYSLASSLGVGRSLETSFKTALNELQVLYPDQDAYIIKEFGYICTRLNLNEPVDNALQDFARRSGVDDICNFADVIAICRRTGGNLVHVVKNTANLIGNKIEIVEDIELMLAKQRFEQKILNIMPVVFIGLIRFGGSGYVDTLYLSPKGYLLMAVAATILAGSYLWSKKIIDIKV